MTHHEKWIEKKIDAEMNAAQRETVAKLRVKGWIASDPFAKAIPLYFQRKPGTLNGEGYPARPFTIHVRKDGKCYRGYPGHSSDAWRNNARKYQHSK